MLAKFSQGRRRLYLDTNPYQLLITGGTGAGKTTALMRLIQLELNRGSIVISLNDAKGLLEHAAAYLPEKYIAYHNINRIKYYNLQPTKVPIKLIHPITTKIEDIYSPPIEFKSVGLTNIHETEIDMILESTDKGNTKRIILNSISKMDKKNTFYDFITEINKRSKREEITISKSKEIRLPDPEKFGLVGASAGTVKIADSIYSNFSFQSDHPIIQPLNSKYTLDVKKDLFTDQPSLKIIVDHFISDKKTKDFFKLHCINQIIKHAKKVKKRIVLIFDELKDLTPTSEKGHSNIFAKRLIAGFNTHFRSNRISTISTSQSIAALNRNLFRSNCFTAELHGTNVGQDLLTMQEIFKWDKNIIQKVQALPRHHYFGRGIENYDILGSKPITIYPPTIPIKEPTFSVEKAFYDEYKEECENYKNTILKEIIMLVENQEKEMRANALEARKKVEALAKKEEEKQEMRFKKQIKVPNIKGLDKKSGYEQYKTLFEKGMEFSDILVALNAHRATVYKYKKKYEVENDILPNKSD